MQKFNVENPFKESRGEELRYNTESVIELDPFNETIPVEVLDGYRPEFKSVEEYTERELRSLEHLKFLIKQPELNLSKVYFGSYDRKQAQQLQDETLMDAFSENVSQRLIDPKDERINPELHKLLRGVDEYKRVFNLSDQEVQILRDEIHKKHFLQFLQPPEIQPTQEDEQQVNTTGGGQPPPDGGDEKDGEDTEDEEGDEAVGVKATNTGGSSGAGGDGQGEVEPTQEEKLQDLGEGAGEPEGSKEGDEEDEIKEEWYQILVEGQPTEKQMEDFNIGKEVNKDVVIAYTDQPQQRGLGLPDIALKLIDIANHMTDEEIQKYMNAQKKGSMSGGGYTKVGRQIVNKIKGISAVGNRYSLKEAKNLKTKAQQYSFWLLNKEQQGFKQAPPTATPAPAPAPAVPAPPTQQTPELVPVLAPAPAPAPAQRTGEASGRLLSILRQRHIDNNPFL